MGKALDVVKRYYEYFDTKRKGWRELVTDDVRMEGPMQRASGAKEFIALTEQFLQFHKATKVLKRFEDGDNVCSIYTFTLNTPAGSTMTCEVVEWAKVSGSKVAEFKLYYDPREFAKAFGM